MNPLRSSFALLALGCLLLASHARAQPLECTPQNELALQQKVARSVSALKVASYRADATLMDRASGELDKLLGSCPQTMKDRLCDADCYHERASVFLFQAMGLPLLSAKESTSSGLTAPSQLRAEAAKGLALVEQGINRLPRQQGGGPDEKQKDLAFNRYLKASARLSILKARLLMAAGDVWYREASVSRVESLNFLVGKALGNAPPANGRKGSDYYNAMTQYDEAFWVLMEARGGLPEKDLFSSELNALASAEADVSLRLQSIRKGFLYLNIDPDDFTSKSIEVLENKLRTDNELLKKHEENIAQLMEMWSKKHSEHNNLQFDVESATHARAIDVEVGKLAQLQAIADKTSASIQSKRTRLAGELSRFERQRRIREIETDLQRETKELENQLTRIKGERAQESLVLDKEDVLQAMSDIQFNIDMELARFNFATQIDALDNQIDELDNRIDADDKELSLLEIQKKQNEIQRKIEEKRVTAADIVINRIRKSRETVFKSARVPIIQSICAIDAQLAFYSGSAEGFTNDISGASCSPSSGTSDQELNKRICEARDTLSKAEQKDLEDIKKCLDGGGCSAGGVDVKKAVDDAFKRNMDIFKTQEAGIQELKKHAEQQKQNLESIRSAFKDIREGTAFADIALLATGIAAAAADGEEGAGVGLMGPYTFKTFKAVHAVAEAARLTAEKGVRVLERGFEDLQFETQLDETNAQLEKTLKELDNELKNFDAQKEFEKAMRDRAIAEINADLARLTRESNLNVNEQAIQLLECQRREADTNKTIASLRAERASLVAQLQTQTQDTELTQFDIDGQEAVRSQSQLEIDRLQLELEGLQVQTSKVQQDRANLLEMKDALESQMKKVGGFRDRVATLAQKFNAEKALLEDIQKKIKEQTLKIKDEEFAFISSVIENTRVTALERISSLKEQFAKEEDAQRLEEELSAIQQQLSDATKESRDKILELTSKVPEDNREAIFWDFENLQAELSRGAPEFIDGKRRLLENINFTYNLYRNRYNMLTRFTADVSALPADKSFVHNSGDVEKLLENCGTLGGGGVCTPGSLTWSKTLMNGLRAEFTLDKNSGLFQQLMSEGHAQFEISPFARSQEDSKKLGGFVLWDPETMNDNRMMLLLQVVMGLEGKGCGTQQIMVRHLGTGATFARLSADSKEVVPSLVVHRPVHNAGLPVRGVTEAALMAQEYSKFRTGSYNAEGLERLLHTSEDQYPFAGYPLVATYELIANDNLTRCLKSEGAESLKLGFIFVRNDNS